MKNIAQSKTTTSDIPADILAEVDYLEVPPVPGWTCTPFGEWFDANDRRLSREEVARALMRQRANDNQAAVALTPAVPTPVNDNAVAPATVKADIPAALPIADSAPVVGKIEPAPAYEPRPDGNAARAIGSGLTLPSPPVRKRGAPQILGSKRKPAKPKQTFAVDTRNLLAVAKLDAIIGWDGLLTAAYVLSCNGSDNPWNGLSEWSARSFGTYLGASRKLRKDGTSIAGQLQATLIEHKFLEGPFKGERAPEYRVVPFAERTGGTVNKDEDRHHLAWFACTFARGITETERPALWEMARRFKSPAHLYVLALCHQLRSRKMPGLLPSDALWQPYAGQVIAGNGPVSAWAFDSSGGISINPASEFAEMASEALSYLGSKLPLARIVSELIDSKTVEIIPVLFEVEHSNEQEVTPDVYAAMTNPLASEISTATLAKIDGSGGHDRMSAFIDERFGDSVVVPVESKIEQPELRGCLSLPFIPLNDQTDWWLAAVNRQQKHVRKGVEMADGLKPVTATWKKHVEAK